MNIEFSKHFHDKKNNVSLLEGYVEDLENKKKYTLIKVTIFNHINNTYYLCFTKISNNLDYTFIKRQ